MSDTSYISLVSYVSILHSNSRAIFNFLKQLLLRKNWKKISVGLSLNITLHNATWQTLVSRYGDAILIKYRRFATRDN
jgi:hypothetical protein